MDHSFQERMKFFTAANNISANMSDFNENIAIRFLGYDSILQFTLIAKMLLFMYLFGSNAKGISRWTVIVILIFYYLYFNILVIPLATVWEKFISNITRDRGGC